MRSTLLMSRSIAGSRNSPNKRDGHCHAASCLRHSRQPVSQADDENQLGRIPVPARGHSPSDMALPPVHPQPARRRRFVGGTRSGGVLRDSAALGESFQTDDRGLAKGSRRLIRQRRNQQTSRRGDSAAGCFDETPRPEPDKAAPSLTSMTESQRAFYFKEAANSLAYSGSHSQAVLFHGRRRYRGLRGIPRPH